MATETEMQATVKRLEGENKGIATQFHMLRRGYLEVGSTFAGVVRELLLAIADTSDPEAMERAKKHAKEILRHWDAAMEMITKDQERQSNIVQPVREIITPS
jgi:hypothetical protein